MKFRKADVPDQHQLEMAILCTASSIYESPVARNCRSLHQIIAVVEQGIIAEQYMIQVHGFTDDPGRYNDVCKAGHSWEVKAWTVKPGFLERIDPLIDKLRGWRKQFTGKRTYKPSKLAIFGVKNGQYRLYNCYDIDSASIITDQEVADDQFL
tara:strand:- start:4250 stop:4708 length:459 start_codon:yes stop_codon:yes gene_type:complete